MKGTLIDAMRYAGQNPNSDFATKLREEVYRGKHDNNPYVLNGQVDLTPIKDEYELLNPPSRVDLVKKGVSDMFGTIKKTAVDVFDPTEVKSKTAQAITNDNSTAGIDPAALVADTSKRIGSLASGALQLGGQAVDTGVNLVSPTFNKNYVQPAFNFLDENIITPVGKYGGVGAYAFAKLLGSSDAVAQGAQSDIEHPIKDLAMLGVMRGVGEATVGAYKGGKAVVSKVGEAGVKALTGLENTGVVDAVKASLRKQDIQSYLKDIMAGTPRKELPPEARSATGERVPLADETATATLLADTLPRGTNSTNFTTRVNEVIKKISDTSRQLLESTNVSWTPKEFIAYVSRRAERVAAETNIPISEVKKALYEQSLQFIQNYHKGYKHDMLGLYDARIKYDKNNSAGIRKARENKGNPDKAVQLRSAITLEIRNAARDFSVSRIEQVRPDVAQAFTRTQGMLHSLFDAVSDYSVGVTKNIQPNVSFTKRTLNKLIDNPITTTASGAVVGLGTIGTFLSSPLLISTAILTGGVIMAGKAFTSPQLWNGITRTLGLKNLKPHERLALYELREKIKPQVEQFLKDPNLAFEALLQDPAIDTLQPVVKKWLGEPVVSKLSMLENPEVQKAIASSGILGAYMLMSDNDEEKAVHLLKMSLDEQNATQPFGSQDNTVNTQATLVNDNKNQQ